MAILKAKSAVETYKLKASSRDFNDLSGRTGRPDLTEYILENIAEIVELPKEGLFVDVGCGTGLLLKKLRNKSDPLACCKLVGILPSYEEVERVTTEFAKQNIDIEIYYGMIQQMPFDDQSVDYLVCNGVLNAGGQAIDDIDAAFKEFKRVLKSGSKLYVGELPELDEMVERPYGSSVFLWLLWSLRKQSLHRFWLNVKSVFRSIFLGETFIVAPKNIFYMIPDEFIAFASGYGFDLINVSKHRELDSSGNPRENAYRWNYMFCKKVAKLNT